MGFTASNTFSAAARPFAASLAVGLSAAAALTSPPAAAAATPGASSGQLAPHHATPQIGHHRAKAHRVPQHRPKRHRAGQVRAHKRAALRKVIIRAHSAGAPSAMTFATYNICKIECRSGRYAWPSRKDSVARSVAAAGADVLAVQEADRGGGHYLQVADMLARQGLQMASEHVEMTCSGVCGAHILYRTSRMEPVSVPVELVPRLPKRRARSLDDDVSAGLVSLASVSGRAPWGGVKSDRSFSWALLRDKVTGTEFLALSVHLPNEETAAGRAVRVASARGVADWAEGFLAATGKGGLPVVLLGDLNSYDAREPRGPQQQLERAGYRDTFDAQVKINKQYSTVNRTNETARWGGWPPSPPVFGPLGNRIDYVFTKRAGPALMWEIQLRLHNGRFDDRYRASDHNLVLTRFVLR